MQVAEIKTIMEVYVGLPISMVEDSMTYLKTINYLVNNKMIVAHPTLPSGYNILPRGEAYIKVLKDVKLPRIGYLNEQGVLI